MDDDREIAVPLLEFRSPAREDRAGSCLNLGPGCLAIVSCPDAEELFDAIEGLRPDEDYEVKVKGRDWKEYGDFEQFALRGRIGRIFRHEQAWVQNLSLRQNIVLRSMHQGAPPGAVDAGLAELADKFGIVDILDFRPEGIDVGLLTKCQWARAFLGEPELLLLSEPEYELSRGETDVFRGHLAEHLRGGGAAVWVFKGVSSELTGFDNISISSVSL